MQVKTIKLGVFNVVLDNNVFVQSDDTGYYDWSRLYDV